MKKIITFVFTFHVSFFAFNAIEAQIINVPADQPTIQAGINSAFSGDTILVSDGTYLENINFSGKAITVASQFIVDGDTTHINNTIIDGSQPSNPDYGSVISFTSGEDTSSVLSGFTVTGGTGTYFPALNYRLGGGIICHEASASIIYNKIVDNESMHTSGARGGGICNYSTGQENWLVARNNLLQGNACSSATGTQFGGGVYCTANLIFVGNEVCFNTSSGAGSNIASGGGVEFEELTGTMQVFQILDNDVHDNSIEAFNSLGAGISITGGEGTVSRNAVWNNSGTATDLATGAGISISSVRKAIYVTHNEIRNNSLVADWPQGGGINVGLAGDIVNIQDNTIEYNTLYGENACYGGAACLFQNKDVIFTGNQINGNSVTGIEFAAGAGIWSEGNTGMTRFVNNSFTENIAPGIGYGGGLAIYDAQLIEIEVERNFFENNSISNGGGLWAYNSYNMIVANNIFTGNEGSYAGGAICLRQYSGMLSGPVPPGISKAVNPSLPDVDTRAVSHPSFINNTYYNNSSASGGAIFSDYQTEFPLVINCNFWHNEANTGQNIYTTSPDSMLISYSNIRTVSPFGVSGKWKGVNNIYADPIFADDICHLDGLSPCVDTGVDSLLFEGIWHFSPGVDFDGLIRPWANGGIDIGADECDIFVKLPDFFVSFGSAIFLSQNMPNPFRNSSKIEFYLEDNQFVSLKIYDISGREIKTLFSGNPGQGNHSYSIDAANLKPGIYIYTLTAGDERLTRKMEVQ